MPHRVILADDSVAIHRVVNLTFTGENVEIVSVHNGTDAIRRANEQQPDLVIADIFMPGLNGYDVCERLRQHPATRTIPVILLVGAFESFDQVKATEVGATAHIMKPIEPQSLLKLVNGLLSQSRTENGQATATAAAESVHIPPPRREPLESLDSAANDSKEEIKQMESFIKSLTPQGSKQDKPHSREFFEAKEPIRVFNLSEPEPIKFVSEKPVDPKKFIGEEDLVAHLSGEISEAERSDIENNDAGNQVGLRTEDLELIIGLDVPAQSGDEGSQSGENAKSPTAATSVSPELVNEISERVVTRLREALREEVKKAIEDALNEYLKDL